MGAWGAGIFANDTAADVRGQWRAAVLAGTDAAAASAALTEGWDDDVADDPTETEFWTGLAAAQHETGHLQPDVRDRALALIEAGGDAELYEDGAPARLRALRGLAGKLTGPQPKPKRLRGPRPGPDPGVEVGDVVRIWSSDRTVSVLYAVTRMHHHERKRWPELLGVYWEGGDVPSREELERLPYLSKVDFSSFNRGDGLPGHDWAAPQELTIVVQRPGDELRAEIGEVVATGVRRDPPYPESGTVSGWTAIVATLDGGGLAFMLEATRRRLARYGPDPRAWERVRREYWSSPRVAAFAEQVAQLRTASGDPDAGRQRRRIYEMLGERSDEDDGDPGDEPA